MLIPDINEPQIRTIVYSGTAKFKLVKGEMTGKLFVEIHDLYDGKNRHHLVCSVNKNKFHGEKIKYTCYCCDIAIPTELLEVCWLVNHEFFDAN